MTEFIVSACRGGPRTKPGYCAFTGSNAISLLQFLLMGAYRNYWGCRGTATMQVLVDVCNLMFELAEHREKDVIDELML